MGYIVYIFFGGGIVAPSVFVNVVTGLIVAEYIHFVVTVCLHIAGVLNISVFHDFSSIFRVCQVTHFRNVLPSIMCV